MLYGYAHISTRSQNEYRQILTLQEVGLQRKTSFRIRNPTRTLVAHVQAIVSDAEA